MVPFWSKIGPKMVPLATQNLDNCKGGPTKIYVGSTSTEVVAQGAAQSSLGGAQGANLAKPSRKLWFLKTYPGGD